MRSEYKFTDLPGLKATGLGKIQFRLSLFLLTCFLYISGGLLRLRQLADRNDRMLKGLIELLGITYGDPIGGTLQSLK